MPAKAKDYSTVIADIRSDYPRELVLEVLEAVVTKVPGYARTRTFHYYLDSLINHLMGMRYRQFSVNTLGHMPINAKGCFGVFINANFPAGHRIYDFVTLVYGRRQ